MDVPRTAPEVAFFHQAPVQKSLERILYIWGVRCALQLQRVQYIRLASYSVLAGRSMPPSVYVCRQATGAGHHW